MKVVAQLSQQLATITLIAAFMSSLAFGLMTSVGETEMEDADERWAALDDDVWRILAYVRLSIILRSFVAATATLNLYALVTSAGIMLFISNLPPEVVDGKKENGEFSLHYFDFLLASVYGALALATYCLMPCFYYIGWIKFPLETVEGRWFFISGAWVMLALCCVLAYLVYIHAKVAKGGLSFRKAPRHSFAFGVLAVGGLSTFINMVT